MKKIFIFAAAAAMFASCAQDELINEINPSSKVEKAIGFSTIADKVTRNAENSSATDVSGLENYHTTFKVWGYKNILQSGNTYSHTQVFGTSGAGEEITYSEAAVDPFVANSWTYSPLRYWDKTAANYEFHAAAPAGTNWTWTATSENTGEGKGKFTTTGTIANSSLPLVGTDSKDVTGQPDDVFGDADLMIATDVVVNNADYSSDPVQLHFNHILSRLNIGVRMQGVQVTYDKKNLTVKVGETEGVVVYESSVEGEASNMYMEEGGDYFLINENAEGAYSKGALYDGSGTMTPKKSADDDKTKPTRGIVNLKGITVKNLDSTGSFDESLASGTTLSSGTSKRWTSTTTPLDLGFPNTVITGTSDDDDATDGFNLSKVVEDEDGNEIAVEDYKLLYQGLVIPQVAAYEPLAVDGSDLAVDGAKPYVHVNYTIDGEEFNAYYNLASVFNTKLGDDYVSDNGAKVVYNVKTPATPVQLYFKDAALYSDAALTEGSKIEDYIIYDESQDKYYSADWNTEYTSENEIVTNATTIILGSKTDSSLIYAKVSEVANAGDIEFCEGWQNNIWITISPIAIYFDADVYEWVTKYDSFDNDEAIKIE